MLFNIAAGFQKLYHYVNWKKRHDTTQATDFPQFALPIFSQWDRNSAVSDTPVLNYRSIYS